MDINASSKRSPFLRADSPGDNSRDRFAEDSSLGGHRRQRTYEDLDLPSYPSFSGNLFTRNSIHLDPHIQRLQHGQERLHVLSSQHIDILGEIHESQLFNSGALFLIGNCVVGNASLDLVEPAIAEAWNYNPLLHIVGRALPIVTDTTGVIAGPEGLPPPSRNVFYDSTSHIQAPFEQIEQSFSEPDPPVIGCDNDLSDQLSFQFPDMEDISVQPISHTLNLSINANDSFAEYVSLQSSTLDSSVDFDPPMVGANLFDTPVRRSSRVPEAMSTTSRRTLPELNSIKSSPQQTVITGYNVPIDVRRSKKALSRFLGGPTCPHCPKSFATKGRQFK